MKSNIKIVFIFIALMLIPFMSFSQIQTGYVRTVGRPGNDYGNRLSGVQIEVAGLHGQVVSAENGYFEFNLQGGKDRYQLLSVYLDNYELNEKETIGRIYGVTKVPHEIVMVSLTEKQLIRQNFKAQNEQRWRNENDELQRKLEQKEIEINEYRIRYQELEAAYNNRDQLITEMVEQYSHTDYAILKPIDAEINSLIEQGELEKADSVINSLKLSSLEVVRDSTIKARARMDESITNIDSTLLMGYRRKIDVFRAGFPKDSAIVYYDKMIKIDSTNLHILFEAGKFASNYLSRNDLALKYFESFLRQSLSLYGENAPNSIASYESIGHVLLTSGEHTKALNCYHKQLEISQKLYGKKHKSILEAYYNIANACSLKGDYDEALDFFQRALSLSIKGYGDSQNLCFIYNGLGSIYCDKGDYEQALKYGQIALDLKLKEYGINHRYTANSYQNIGNALTGQEKYSEALNYHMKALDIRKALYGEIHSEIADSYYAIGKIKSSLGEYDSALEALVKALEIWQRILDNNHPYMADCYYEIGSALYDIGEYGKALDYMKKALEIRTHIYDVNHILIGDAYSGVGDALNQLGDYDLALDYIKKALKIRLQAYGECHKLIAESYFSLGTALYYKGDYDLALDYLNRCLDIRFKIYGREHHIIADSYYTIGITLFHKGNYNEALDYLQKALQVDIMNYGVKHRYTADSYGSIGLVYQNSGDYERALHYEKKALEIYLSLFGYNNEYVATAYNNIGSVYADLNKQYEAIYNYKQALRIRQTIYGDIHPEVLKCYFNLSLTYIDLEIYDKAAEYTKMLIDIFEMQPEENQDKLLSLRIQLHQILNCYSQENAAEYIKDKIYIMTIEDGTPIAKLGYSGEIYLLEFGDWNLEMQEDILKYDFELKGKSKKIVFMQDGKVFQVKFDNVIGGRFGLKKIAAEERKKILKLYREWKNADEYGL